MKDKFTDEQIQAIEMAILKVYSHPDGAQIAKDKIITELTRSNDFRDGEVVYSEELERASDYSGYYVHRDEGEECYPYRHLTLAEMPQAVSDLLMFVEKMANGLVVNPCEESRVAAIAFREVIHE